MATIDRSAGSERLQHLFVDGLKNAHALEKQALSIMTPQVARLDHYPELRDRLQAHIEETNEQIRRLDEILATFDSSRSMLKDAALSMTGGMAAIGHSAAGDEILKNSFANYAFENFEIASYRSLITMGDDIALGSATGLLQQTLREEESMAQFMADNLPMITRRYMQLYAEEGAFEAKI